MSNLLKRERTGVRPIESAYQLELAVGSSHIISMLCPASRSNCIEQLATDFVATHGAVDLARFLTALADRLDVRENNTGALAVRNFAAIGVSPLQSATAAPGEPSKRSKSSSVARFIK